MHLLKKPVLKYESAFYRTALSISIPVIISNLINIGLNMIDTIMIGKLGVLELSGVGAANRITFICSLMCFGFYGGMMIFVSQYWGAKDIKNIHRLLGVAYSCGIALCLCFMAISLIWPYQLMGLFGEDPRVIQHGVDFLRIVQISYLFSAVTFLLTCASRSIHRLLVPTIINTFALLFNVFFNYCLIFGKFGFPTWGVKGAAIATVGARLIEMILLLLYVYVLSKDSL
ncbi:MAG: MATE family efflux transporter [Clostridiales bacterium]